MIEVTKLSKKFDETYVLKEVSTFFEKGKTNLIIGQSGSGKTVFLKCLLGLHIINKGEIIYDGKSSNKMSDFDKLNLRREMGMVFQGSALFDSMTIEENVMFPLKMFQEMEMEEMKTRVNEVLKRVELENSNNKMPREASGGMQKRVAIALSLIHI